MSNKEISIVIVSYHSHDSIVKCLSTIMEYTLVPYEVIIVDNSENGKTLKVLKTFSEINPSYPLIIRKAEYNIGFARGCNLGASVATGKYIVFLNPDTYLLNDALVILRDFVEKKNKAIIVGPAIIGRDGNVTRTCRNLPTCWRIFLDIIGLDRLLGQYRLMHYSHSEDSQVEQIIGACLFVRRDYYCRLHGFDERFFMYFEEVDFCKRALDERYEVWFCPQAKIGHIAGLSTDQPGVKARMIVELRKSRLKYFTKHFGQMQCLCMSVLNRMEGLSKGTVFSLLCLIIGGRQYREKAKGYWKTVL